jgi:hypothetical protein
MESSADANADRGRRALNEAWERRLLEVSTEHERERSALTTELQRAKHDALEELATVVARHEATLQQALEHARRQHEEQAQKQQLRHAEALNAAQVALQEQSEQSRAAKACVDADAEKVARCEARLREEALARSHSLANGLRANMGVALALLQGELSACEEDMAAARKRVRDVEASAEAATTATHTERARDLAQHEAEVGQLQHAAELSNQRANEALAAQTKALEKANEAEVRAESAHRAMVQADAKLKAVKKEVLRITAEHATQSKVKVAAAAAAAKADAELEAKTRLNQAVEKTTAEVTVQVEARVQAEARVRLDAAVKAVQAAAQHELEEARATMQQDLAQYQAAFDLAQATLRSNADRAVSELDRGLAAANRIADHAKEDQAKEQKEKERALKRVDELEKALIAIAGEAALLNH